MTTSPAGRREGPRPETPPPPFPASNPVQRLLLGIATAPRLLDDHLAHLSRCMRSRPGAETVLLFACYATGLAGSLLETTARTPAARRLLSGPGRAPLLALQLGGRLRALSGLISEARTAARLWGLLGLYLSARELLVRSRRRRQGKPAADDDDDDDAPPLDIPLSSLQILSLVIYQAAENASFLASKKVLPLRAGTQTRLALLSVRAWGLYVAMEAARLLVERTRGRRAVDAKAHARWLASWNRSFYRNLAWAPLTVHWGSADGGFLPDWLVPLLAFYPSCGAMRDLWKETA